MYSGFGLSREGPRLIVIGSGEKIEESHMQ